MTSTPLAIVGASARAAAYSALRAGYQPISCDLFADDDLAAIAIAETIANYPQGFERWLTRQRSGTAWIYTGGLENHPDLLDRMAKQRPLWGNAGNPLRRCRDSQYLFGALRQKGLCVPLTFPASHANPPVEDDNSWLWKSGGGSAGSGVVAASSAPDRAASGGYFQQLIEGIPHSVALVVSPQGHTILGVCRQLVGPPWTAKPFQFAGAIGPVFVSNRARIQLESVGEVLVELGLQGLVGVDFVLDAAHAVWPIEVNPRYTASVELLERSTGIAALALHFEGCLGNPISVRLNKANERAVWGKHIVYAESPLVIDEPLHKGLWKQRGSDSSPMLADIPADGTSIETGEPVLTLFATANSEQDVEAALLSARNRYAGLPLERSSLES